MNINPKLYSYCIPVDDGAAPNPYGGICTLVICKPVIRRNAQIGDWIVGTGSKNSPIGDISDKVVYTMRVTKKMTMQEYDNCCKKNYPEKMPDWNSKEFFKWVGDCIYDYEDPVNPKIRKGVHSELNQEHDLSGKFALISNHFHYFGDNPIQLDKRLTPIIHKNQGHKSNANNSYIKDFIAWIESRKFKLNSLNGEPQLKKEFLKNRAYSSKCSNQRLNEAMIDEDIEIKNC